ncbi:TonB-dependent siderophore receptor [Hyphomonas sp. CACIAM 19H1]|uniref:TonB-dependent siderophore receptor n=1 Tax=Hyphomonas sp. CACIAM 19H1 TaxID=1873716 RepID=UPI001F2844BC|nr:TonB-dependent siderophore receptor [Hyphomonas sp. CACIAM 19H1]
MGHRKYFRATLLGAAAGLVMLAPSAIAQEGGEDAASVQETIIVIAPEYVPQDGATANKSNIPLIQTPQSVSIVTRDQIDLLNFIDAQQAVRYTAGAFGENYGPDLRFDFISARGFRPREYIDGLAVPATTTISSVGLDLYAFQTFSLLKGPASALYGNSPPGGLYNLSLRRPSDEFGGELAIKYGTQDYKQVAGTVAGPLGESFSYSLTGLYRDRETFRDLVSSDRSLISPALTWNITPSTDLTLLGYFQSDAVNGDTNGYLPVAGTLEPNPNGKIGPTTNLGNPNNRYDRDQWGIGYELVHAFNENVRFISNTRVSRYAERSSTLFYGGGGFINTTNPSDPSYYRTIQQYNYAYKEDVDGFTTDNRLDIDFTTGALTHDLIAGYDYRKAENEAGFGFVFAGTIDAFNPTYPPQASYKPGYPTPYNDQTLKHSGLYVQDHIGYGNLYVTLSGRYDDVKVKNHLTGFDLSEDAFTYRVGANYIFDSGLAPYVSYATSFEPVLGSDVDTGETFKPSEGEQVEAGIKYDARGLPDGVDLLLTAAVYQINQNNIVSAVGSPTPIASKQTGEVEVNGFEVELVSRINDQLSINASYSRTDSEVLASSTPQEVGAELPVTPKDKASLFVDWTFVQGPMAGLGIGGGVRYTSESQGGLPGPFAPIVYTGEASTLFDAVIRYDTQNWRFAINGSNIFDEEYVARCAGVANCTYGAGRQVIATVTRKF